MEHPFFQVAPVAGVVSGRLERDSGVVALANPTIK
jgi:hypothetical protein